MGGSDDPFVVNEGTPAGGDLAIYTYHTQADLVGDLTIRCLPSVYDPLTWYNRKKFMGFLIKLVNDVYVS